MTFARKLLMKKVDRSKNTWFLFCEIFIKSKNHSKKFHLNVVISKGVPQPQDLQNRIFYDLVMILTWYLGWGDFRAWQTFSKFLVNRCWLNFDIWCLICQNRPKNAKKGNCWLKSRGVSVISCLQPWYLGEKWPKGYRTT